MQTSDILLTDQVAIVTGGGGGIGRSIALAMATFGADVVIGDIVPERTEEVAERVRELGRRALPVPMDVMDPEQIRGMIAKADETFGRVDILVNNAGGVSFKPLLQMSDNSFRRHLEINLVSAFVAVKAAAPIMIRGGRGGSIINISSIEGERAAPNVGAYAAGKAGMINLTKTLALELSDHGIRVNAITPDHTVTPGNRGNRTGPVDPSKQRERAPNATEGMQAIIPLGRESHSDEVGSVAAFLASSLASYVTGVIMPVDGGTSAGSGWMRTQKGVWALHDKLAATPAERMQQ